MSRVLQEEEATHSGTIKLLHNIARLIPETVRENGFVMTLGSHPASRDEVSLGGKNNEPTADLSQNTQLAPID